MTRLNVWNSCNRVLDDKWKETQKEAHRVRLESIHGTTSQLSPPRPVRVATTPTFKAQPKSKSPAAKARQAEIERENLKMIKKIVELQNGGGASAHSKRQGVNGKRRSRPSSAAGTSRSSYSSQGSMAGNHGYTPNPLTGLAPGGGLGVPTAASHVLYTRHAATATHHFANQNDVALNFVPGKKTTAEVRRRTQVQIQHENRQMLQRILSSKTTFSRASWQNEERERRKLLENISRFSHLSKRHSSPSQASLLGSTTPSKSRARLAIERASSEQDPPSTRWSHTRSHHTLKAFHDEPDGDYNGGLLSRSQVIRTGSPVTHLRDHVRPQSASASTGPSRSVSMTYFRMANGEYVEVQTSRSAPRTRRDEEGFGGVQKEDEEDDSVSEVMERMGIEDEDGTVEETKGGQECRDDDGEDPDERDGRWHHRPQKQCELEDELDEQGVLQDEHE